MADETNGAPAAPPTPTPTPKMQVVTQYVRDLSFENIAAQKGLGSDGKPDVRIASTSTPSRRPATATRWR